MFDRVHRSAHRRSRSPQNVKAMRRVCIEISWWLTHSAEAATFVEQSVAWPVGNTSGRTFYCLPGLSLQTGVVKTQVAECK